MLDPFSGIDTTLIESINNKRKAVGIKEKHYNLMPKEDKKEGKPISEKIIPSEKTGTIYNDIIKSIEYNKACSYI